MNRRVFVGIGLALVVAIGATLGWRTWRRRSTTTAPVSEMTSVSAPTTTGTPRGDVTIDARRQQLIGVRTVVARRMALAPEIRAVGTVQYDETRLTDINVKVEGWIRDLDVDYTGQAIVQGQPLFTLYSPDLLATENEYVLALKTRDDLQASTLADAHVRADQLVAAARRRLALWDLSDDDLHAVETTRQANDTAVIRAPLAGVVIEKTAVRGRHVMPGESLYKIADLSTVWVDADLYESELPLVHVGDRATVTLDAYPGQHFTGRAVYIYPYLAPDTRTDKVRFELANPLGRLKPGMYANVSLTTSAGEGLVVPSDAVLDSGTEQVVFVADGDGHFTPRHVTVGRRMSDQIEITAGLKNGDTVATGANFFLDSESQLSASLPSYAAPSASSPSSAPTPALQITLRTMPDPAKTGENQFEATVKDSSGAAVDGAEVSVQLYMAAMPTMNMPAMRNEVPLSSAGGGTYRGTGQVMMAGRWEATVTVSRGGQRLGSAQLPLIAQ